MARTRRVKSEGVIVASSAQSIFEPEPQALAVRPQDNIPALDSDLTEEQKQEFVHLLNGLMPIEARAKQLVKLAQFVDTKRAPVALRAIQEINALTGMSKNGASEDSPMFLLPNDTTVSVNITKVEK